MPESPKPGFGDRVRILTSPEVPPEIAGRIAKVYGWSVPSSSGVGPVIGGRGEDFALGLVLEETDAEDTFWLEPHFVEFVDHGGTQQFTLGHGPDAISTWRDEDGNWHDGISPIAR
jgi:hypothetical protein